MTEVAPKTVSELNKAIAGFVKRLEKSEKFVIDQAPDICREMLIEEQIQCNLGLIAHGVVFFLLLSLAALGLYWFRTYGEEGWKFAGGCTMMIGSVGLLPCGGILFETFERLLLVKKTPKLYLLREFKEMIR